MTPADKLRAAARRLRELAEDATPGPWRSMTDAGGGSFVEQVDDGIDAGHWVASAYECEDHPAAHQPDAAWIAALSPAVAEPLAAWLDTHVEWAHEAQAMVDDGLVSGPIDDRWPGLTAALALADALGVGGETE